MYLSDHIQRGPCNYPKDVFRRRKTSFAVFRRRKTAKDVFRPRKTVTKARIRRFCTVSLKAACRIPQDNYKTQLLSRHVLGKAFWKCGVAVKNCKIKQETRKVEKERRRGISSKPPYAVTSTNAVTIWYDRRTAPPHTAAKLF